MSDYTRAGSGGATHFTDKDALSSGDANKVIVGSQFDDEFQALVTAVNSKFDSDDYASQAEVEAESTLTKIVSPGRLAQWADENGGLVGEIQELADPGADRLFMWDDSASASANVILAALGSGLAFSTNTLKMSHLGFEDLVDPNADRMAFWDDTAAKFDWLVPGTALTITSQTIDLDHLGFEDLVDPNGDRIAFWDDSAGKFDWLVPNSGISISLLNLNVDHDAALNFVAGEHILHSGVDVVAGAGMTGGGAIDASRTLNVIGGDGITANADNIALTAQSASTTVPISIASGVLGWDSASITEIDGAAIDQAADGFLVDNAGVLNVVPYDQMGLLVLSQDAAQTFAITDANTINVLTGSTNRIWTIPANSAVAFTIGSVIICVNSGTGDLQILGDTGVIIDSVFHAAGSTAQNDTVLDGGTAALIKTATDTWSLSGDIKD